MHTSKYKADGERLYLGQTLYVYAVFLDHRHKMLGIPHAYMFYFEGSFVRRTDYPQDTSRKSVNLSVSFYLF